MKISVQSGIGCFSVEQGDPVTNAMYTSLIVSQGTFFINNKFKSRLNEIKKISKESENKVQAYCFEALQWLVDKGMIFNLNVTTERDNQKLGINAIITAEKRNKEPVTFTYFVRVV